MINIADMRSKSIEDLQKEILQLRKQQFDLRMQKGSGEAVKTHTIPQLRRTIATIKTILHEKNREVSK